MDQALPASGPSDVPGAPSRTGWVSASIDLPSTALGFTTPPATAHVRFLPTRTGWRALVWSAHNDPSAILGWFCSHGSFQPLATSSGPGRVLVLDFDQAPSGWQRFLDPFARQRVVVRPGGLATLAIEGPRPALKVLAEWLSHEGIETSFGHIGSASRPSRSEALLTAHQRTALVRAVAAGYYDVPRRVRLEDVAGALDTSAGALSELLRRAEHRIILAHLDATGPRAVPGDAPMDPQLWLDLDDGGATWKALGTPPGPAPQGEVEHLQRERELEVSVERYEALTQELRLANEVAVRANEELMRAGADAQLAREELQAANEELTSINDELLRGTEALQAAGNDLLGVFAVVDIPILMVGPDLKLRGWTPAAETVLRLMPTDVGRRVTDLSHTLDVGDLGAPVEEVLGTLRPKEVHVRDEAGRAFALRIRPYSIAKERVQGAVIMLLPRA